MTYSQAITYLNNFVNYEKKDSYSYRKSFGLERIKGFLRLLGDPQEGLKCLHIAGTKGKGSVCVFAANILRAAGYKVGLYTSPHLVDVRERIRVFGLGSRVPGLGSGQTGDRRLKTGDCFEGMISHRELTLLAERLKPVIERYARISQSGALTFFEVFTALAFLYFREKKVDYAVLETGLGGRLDATNVSGSLVCGITPISYDHTQYLGNTLKQIAGEKAGIIKSRQLSAVSRQLIVISAHQEKEAREAIRRRCVQKKARLYEIGRDITWQERGFKSGPRPWLLEAKPRPSGLQSFDLQGIKQRYNNLKIQLLGKHQLANASLAVGMVEALGDDNIKPAHVRRGLKEALWPGRLEVVSRNPFVVLDGAQNAASAQALKEAIKDNFRYQRLILVLGMSGDKDIPGVAGEFSDFCDRVILTKADNPRAARPRKLAAYFPGKEVVITDSVKKALAKAKAAAKKGDLILIAGSLFVVGEARAKSHPG